jgi:type IV pilus assembly protein PilC
MADTYAYRVRDKEGKLLEGSLDADSPTLVADKLRQMGYVPVAIDRQDATALKKEISFGGGKVKLGDVAIFCRQFATMINSGLSLIRALHILGEQTESPKLAKVLIEVREDIETGSSLSQALAKHPKVFNRLFVAMTKAGETGGVLDDVLLRLADTIEKQVELRRKIKSAMTYPIAVLGLVVLIMAAMLLFVVPTFETLFSTLGGQLPLPTRILLAASKILVTKFVFIVAFWAAVGFAFKKWVNTDKGRDTWDAFKLRVPVFGKLVHKTAMTRFSNTLSVLLRSGVSILESLAITSETVNNSVVEKAVRDVQASVEQGESISKPLGTHAVFPPMVVQMLAVGEETGAVDEMLEKVGEFYEQEVEATVNALTSLLEPLLIVVLGGAVGGMVVALYMPMFSIINLVQ